MRIILTSILICFATLAVAHDNHYAISDDMKNWFQGLKSEKGPCCADADGSVIQDADWESKDNHYRVRIEEKWWDVPDGAVINAPNLYGPTMVWPIRQNGNSYGYGVKSGTIVDIRCFMPGSMG